MKGRKSDKMKMTGKKAIINSIQNLHSDLIHLLIQHSHFHVWHPMITRIWCTQMADMLILLDILILLYSNPLLSYHYLNEELCGVKMCIISEHNKIPWPSKARQTFTTSQKTVHSSLVLHRRWLFVSGLCCIPGPTTRLTNTHSGHYQ